MRNFRANASTTCQPTLCRVRSYSGPGLPSPTISFMRPRRVQCAAMDALPAIVDGDLDEVRALCEKYQREAADAFRFGREGDVRSAKSDLDFVVEFEWDPILRTWAPLA